MSICGVPNAERPGSWEPGRFDVVTMQAYALDLRLLSLSDLAATYSPTS